jgi:diadenosine tetraphosphatase ApaH/serine/threonine PP2A family protein phosphatase
MRTLVISDIHASLEGMDACLVAAKDKYDAVFNLGDVVGYGASPIEVVEKSIALGGLFVRGNHDKACAGLSNLDDFNPIAALAAMWTRKVLTPAELDWVKNLPIGPIKPEKVSDVQCVHGSPLDEDQYIIAARDAYEPLASAKERITFFGHTHIQGGFSLGTNDDGTPEVTILRPFYDTTDQLETFELPLFDNLRYLINPGSAGQPRDGDWRVAFAIYDDEAKLVTFFRVPYDIKSAQDRIYKANLPDRLATRLDTGH